MHHLGNRALVLLWYVRSKGKTARHLHFDLPLALLHRVLACSTFFVCSTLCTHSQLFLCFPASPPVSRCRLHSSVLPVLLPPGRSCVFASPTIWHACVFFPLCSTSKAHNTTPHTPQGSVSSPPCIGGDRDDGYGPERGHHGGPPSPRSTRHQQFHHLCSSSSSTSSSSRRKAASSGKTVGGIPFCPSSWRKDCGWDRHSKHATTFVNPSLAAALHPRHRYWSRLHSPAPARGTSWPC